MRDNFWSFDRRSHWTERDVMGDNSDPNSPVLSLALSPSLQTFLPFLRAHSPVPDLSPISLPIPSRPRSNGLGRDDCRFTRPTSSALPRRLLQSRSPNLSLARVNDKW
ncbi:hypothetical protein ACLOJK_013710 [Asimina triloba]